MHRATQILPFALTAAALAACAVIPAAHRGFECLGQALPTTAPALIAVSGQVRQNAIVPNALRGAYVFAFRTGDTTTLAADTSDTPGAYSLLITTGECRLTATSAPPTVRTSPPMPIPPFPSPPTRPKTSHGHHRGVLIPGCGGGHYAGGGRRIHRPRRDGLHRHASRGATVSSNPAGQVRYNAGGRAELRGSVHGVRRRRLHANVAAGNVTIQASASGHTLRSHIVNARANAITLTQIQP